MEMAFKSYRFKREIEFLGAGFICALIFSGCSNGKAQVEMNSTSFFAMDTVMDIQIAGDEALLSEAENMVMDLEERLSVTNPNSEIGKINKDKIGRLSADSAEILNGGLEICEKTDGALDLSIYPVLKEWGFTTGEYQVPSDEAIDALLENVDYSKIQINKNENGTEDVVIPENMEIDLGSVVKGYTSQALHDYFKENGVESALINLGGNVQCLGKKEGTKPWRIAIKSPFLDSKTGILGVLNAEDTAIVTSGGYERYFEEDGHIYWHIIDPATGRPAESGLASVTIIGDDGLTCDALSTSLFVKGLDGAISYLEANEGYDAILVTMDGDIYITKGIEDDFSLESEYADSTINVIME